jgi:hypothetical protein
MLLVCFFVDIDNVTNVAYTVVLIVSVMLMMMMLMLKDYSMIVLMRNIPHHMPVENIVL